MDWQSKFLCPGLQHLGVSHSQQQRLLSNILIGWVIGEEHIPGETFGGRGTVYSWPGKVSHLTNGIKKEAQIFWASLFGFSTSGNGGEFYPPVWHVQLAGLPIQPYFNIPDRRLRQVIPPTSNVWVGQGHLWGMYCFPPLGKWGSPITIFQVYSKRTSSGSSTGSFPGVWLYFWFLKGYSPLCSMPAAGTSDIYPKIDSVGGYCCKCRVGGIGHPLPPNLVS